MENLELFYLAREQLTFGLLSTHRFLVYVGIHVLNLKMEIFNPISDINAI